MKRMQHCDCCGEELGVFDNWDHEPLSCGKRECEKEIREIVRASEEEIRETAERDNYDRYR